MAEAGFSSFRRGSSRLSSRPFANLREKVMNTHALTHPRSHAPTLPRTHARTPYGSSTQVPPKSLSQSQSRFQRSWLVRLQACLPPRLGGNAEIGDRLAPPPFELIGVAGAAAYLPHRAYLPIRHVRRLEVRPGMTKRGGRGKITHSIPSVSLSLARKYVQTWEHRKSFVAR